MKAVCRDRGIGDGRREPVLTQLSQPSVSLYMTRAKFVMALVKIVHNVKGTGADLLPVPTITLCYRRDECTMLCIGLSFTIARFSAAKATALFGNRRVFCL